MAPADPTDGDRVRELPDARPPAWVRIPLSDDEALVLSDWIHGLRDDPAEPSDEAVWPALYAIDGPFASSSPLVFAPDYLDRVAAARTRIRAGADGGRPPGLLVALTADQAVVLADWLRRLPMTEDRPHRPLRRIRTVIEAAGSAGVSLPAARRRLFASMGRDEDGSPIDDLPGARPACDRTRRLLSESRLTARENRPRPG